MPKNNNTEAKKSTESRAEPSAPVVYLTLGHENEIKGDTKTERVFFTDIRQNGRTGVYTNIASKTPDTLPTLLTFGTNKYINIKYNEMFDQFLNDLYGRFDPEFIDLINDKYQLEGVIESYMINGFVKCKIDAEKFNSSFFTTVEGEGKAHKFVPLKNCDFMYDRILNGVYTLKVSGLWRKESLINGRYQTTHSGISYKVLNVLVKEYKNSETEADEYEESIFTQLREDSLSLLEE